MLVFKDVLLISLNFEQVIVIIVDDTNVQHLFKSIIYMKIYLRA